MSEDFPPIEDGSIAVMNPTTYRHWRTLGDPRPVELRTEYPDGNVVFTTREDLATMEGPPPAEIQEIMRRVYERLEAS